MAAELGNPLAEIAYRTAYLRDLEDVSRDVLLEELDGILAAVERERQVLERAVSAAEQAATIAGQRAPHRRPRLRLILSDDDC